MKAYIAPQVEVTEVETRSTIMAASSAPMSIFNEEVSFGSEGFDFAAPGFNSSDWDD